MQTACVREETGIATDQLMFRTEWRQPAKSVCVTSRPNPVSHSSSIGDS